MKARSNSLNGGEGEVKSLQSEKVVYANSGVSFKSIFGLLGNDTIIKSAKAESSKDESKPVNRARSQSAAIELKDVDAKNTSVNKPTFAQFMKGIFGLANDQSAEQQASIIPTQDGIN